MQVVALVHEEDGTFGVSFPDFPGCVTAADTLDGAAAKAREVLAFHADGMAEDGLALPAVRTLDELRKDKEARADMRGALIMLVPYDPPSRAVRINLTMDEALLARVDQAASRAGESRSGFLAAAARKRLAAG